MVQLCLWTKIHTKQWLVLGALAGFSMYACGFSVLQMRQFCLFNNPPRSKWASSEKMIFFPKSASSVSRSVAIFSSLVKAYTQSYSFGGRMKLIICQIRHELCYHYEICTSWKKTVRWCTLYMQTICLQVYKEKLSAMSQNAIAIESGFNSESLENQKRKISSEWNDFKVSKWFWYYWWFIKVKNE